MVRTDHFADHLLLAEMRHRQPVAWQQQDDGTGYFAVLSYAGVAAVASQPDLFSFDESAGAAARLGSGVERAPLARGLSLQAMAHSEPLVRGICRELMAEAREKGPLVEFGHDIAVHVPVRVLGRLLGLPETEWARLRELAEGQPLGRQQAGRPWLTGTDLSRYATAFARSHRARRRTLVDLTTIILEGGGGGRPVSDAAFGRYVTQLVAAGAETTAAMLSSGLVTLLEHHDQLDELRVNPAGIPGAVEEILRWASPLHYSLRTAAADTELEGVAIRAGQQMALYYTSANRDSDVFDAPQHFDIHRNPNPHLSFGAGPHTCVGLHLARLIGRVFFEELLAAFPIIELAGEAVRLPPGLVNGYQRIPVRLA